MKTVLSEVMDISREVGELLLKLRSTTTQLRQKTSNPRDILTTADLKSEELVMQKLNQRFPGDAILSEETVNEVSDYQGRVWIVDPLDGTYRYASRETGFSVIIGLCIDGVPELGVVYDPLNRIYYFAESGGSAFVKKVGGKPEIIRVSNTSILKGARAFIKTSPDGNSSFDRQAKSLPVTRLPITSGAGLLIMAVARGAVDFYFDSALLVGKWDTCGTQVILEAAGGIITGTKPFDYKQEEGKWGDIFWASNNTLHQLLREEVERI